MIHLHKEALVVIALVLAVFVTAILTLAACLGCRGTSRQNVPRQFGTLNELLLELEDTETGVLIEEEGRPISLESFFPDILHDKMARQPLAATTIDDDEAGVDEPLI